MDVVQIHVLFEVVQKKVVNALEEVEESPDTLQILQTLLTMTLITMFFCELTPALHLKFS